MTSKDFERVAKRYWARELTSFRVRGPLLYREPLEDMLRGIHFEGSTFDPRKFVIWGFVQPLYVPEKRVILTFGRRLGGGSGFWWELTENNEEQVMADALAVVREEGLGIVERFAGARDFIDHGQMLVSDVENLHYLQAYAYSCARCHRYEAAGKHLVHLLERVGATQTGLSWARDIGARADLLLERIKNHTPDPDELLDQWRAQTLHSIGLQ